MSDTPQTPGASGPESTSPAAEARTGDVRLLMELVVKAIVESPDEVIVEEVKRSGTNVELELQVSPKDIGKVIGKQGRTIRSLRNLAQSAGVVQNLRCNLELLEEDDLEDGDDDQPEEQQPMGRKPLADDNRGNDTRGNVVREKSQPAPDVEDEDDNIGNRA